MIFRRKGPGSDFFPGFFVGLVGRVLMRGPAGGHRNRYAAFLCFQCGRLHRHKLIVHDLVYRIRGFRMRTLTRSFSSVYAIFLTFIVIASEF